MLDQENTDYNIQDLPKLEGLINFASATIMPKFTEILKNQWNVFVQILCPIDFKFLVQKFLVQKFQISCTKIFFLLF
jgi:hypothetical protein